MQILRPGITGFDKPKHINPHSETEIKEFIKCINYPFIPIGKIITPNQTSNYFRLTILDKAENQKFDILIHIFFWLIAALKTESTWMDLEYLEINEELREQLSSFNKEELQVISSHLLNETVLPQEIEVLGKNEIKQIKYWNSRKYGEIIFNGYD